MSHHCLQGRIASLEHKESMVTTRVVYGHTYEWHRRGFWYNSPVGPGENPVQVFPPSGTRTDWYVVAPCTETFNNLRGDDAEARCFSIAAGYITQKLT